MSKKLIIAFAGKKQSGKDTCGNFVINNNDRLFKKDSVIRKYCFANKIKQDICIDILGLNEKQCYGTETEKNSLTRYKWEDLPHYESIPWNEHPIDSVGGKARWKPTGFMSARNLMQEVGTGIFRRMNNNVWVDALLKQIENDIVDIAVICDMRFANEVEAVQAFGGKVIKLTRDIGGADQHGSERELDSDKFDQKKFDAIIDNHNLDIDKTNKVVAATLDKWIHKD
jgi:hypothetical protein